MNTGFLFILVNITKSVNYAKIGASGRYYHDGDGPVAKVAVGESRSIEELSQSLLECQVAIGAAGSVHADELATIDYLHVSFPGEGLQGGCQILRSDVRGLSRSWEGLCADRDSNDAKTNGSGDHSYAHNAPSPCRRPQ